MYSRFQLAKKYLRYYFTASNGKGHGVHSPFVFDFIIHVLRDKKNYDCYKKIEAVRSTLLQNDQAIEVNDFGAGSAINISNKRKISEIAGSSLKSKKFARLLFRIANYYKPKKIIELGTSLGITSAYLASGNENVRVFTCEGAESIATIAENNFSAMGLKNIHLIEGDFDETLPQLLQQINKVDLGFVDGNHRKAPTLNYFYQLLKKISDKSILIFDDIHWSREMEDAWREIKAHPSVTLTVDLFFIGIVFFNTDFKAKQDFIIRF